MNLLGIIGLSVVFGSTGALLQSARPVTDAPLLWLGIALLLAGIGMDLRRLRP